MEPPSPLFTGSTPKASRSASSASRVASHCGSMAQPMPSSSGVTWTSAPKGACDSRNVTIACIAACGSWVGATRRLMRNRVSGLITLNDPSTGCASKPMTVALGLVHRREASEPVPASRYESTTPLSARMSTSSISRSRPPIGSPPSRPGMASSPCLLYMDAMSIAASVLASSTGPPYWPECTGWSSTFTCTSHVALPRRLVVSDGTSGAQLPESATMITSAANSSRCSWMNGMKLGLPISSSPSMNTLMFTPRSSPSALRAP